MNGASCSKPCSRDPSAVRRDRSLVSSMREQMRQLGTPSSKTTSMGQPMYFSARGKSSANCLSGACCVSRGLIVERRQRLDLAELIGGQLPGAGRHVRAHLLRAGRSGDDRGHGFVAAEPGQ